MENLINWSKYKQEYIYKKENLNDYLFEKQLKKMLSVIEGFKSEEERKDNKVIGINGERGSGKSSLLYTFRHYLQNYYDKNKYYVLKPIDPNYLDSSMGLLEIILTYLYDDVENHINKKRKEGKDTTAGKIVRQKIIDQIELQTNMRQDKDFRSKSTPSDLVLEFKKRINFNKAYHELFKQCWALLSENSCENYCKGYLVILIDDIDMVDNQIIYDMLEDVKQILGENTTTVLTYRRVQLQNSIFNGKIKENKNLIDNNFDFINKEEIIKQGRSYIEKLIAENHTIEMDSNEEILKRNLMDLFTDKDDRTNLINKGLDENKNIILNIYKFIEIYTLINIQSQEYLENEKFEKAFSLRHIIQLFESFYSGFVNMNRNENILNNISNNVDVLKEYINRHLGDLLSDEEYYIVKKWIEADFENKNFILYRELSNKGTANLSIDKMQTYNVCLGDVVEIIRDVSRDNSHFKSLSYIIKILYSIELLKSLVEEIYEIRQNGAIGLKDIIYVNNSEQFSLNELKNSEYDSNIYFSKKLKNNSDEISAINIFWNTAYYKLTKYKILPDEFLNFENVDTDKGLNVLKYKDTLEFYKSNEINSNYTDKNQLENKQLTDEKNINEVESKEIIYSVENTVDKVLYTALAARGDIIKDARIKKQNTVNFPLQNYQYRYVYLPSFSKNTKILESGIYETESIQTTFINQTFYKYDFFTILVKEQYLARIIENKPTFLFYSLFDLEFIFRSSFDRKQSDTKIQDVLKKVNRVITNLSENENRLGNLLIKRSEFENGKFNVEPYSKMDIKILTKMIVE